MDWLFDIWTKPFAQWNLLDLGKLGLTCFLAWVLLTFAVIGVLAAKIKWNEATWAKRIGYVIVSLMILAALTVKLWAIP